MPERRPLDYRDFDSLSADVDNLLRVGYDRAGTWNLTQICIHLKGFMEGSMHGFTDKMPAFVPILIGPVYLRLALRTRRLPKGLPAPRQFAPPAEPENPETIAAFQKTLKTIADPATSFVRSPFLGTLSPDNWRQLHLIHSSHHLSHLLPKKP